MSDLPVVATVTRGAALGGTPLDIEDPGAFRIVSLDIGGVSWKRHTADSQYQHGRFLVHAVKDVVVSKLEVRAYGSSASVLANNEDDLLRAFEQFTYDLHVTLDGIEHAWRCEPADWVQNDGRGVDKFSLMAHQQLYSFTLPRAPIPLVGAF